MSYVPSHQTGITLAQPVALTVIEHSTSTTQSITSGNRVQIGTIHNWYGAFSPTISSNQITLVSGYYYYIESMINVYMASGFSAGSYCSFQHYDETSSADAGTPATVFQAAEEDNQLYSQDSCARWLVDCTGAAKDISLKIGTNTGSFSRINYTGGNQPYSGYGRTVIWQLESAP